jgi:sortase A
MGGTAFVEGTSRDDLKKGPGHYLGTPMPGHLGNAAIAGHRTTYGAPFNRINELKIGDKILILTVQGGFTYEMFEQLVVKPTDTYVVDPPPNPLDAWLTLTSCHPKGSASERIVIHAKLVPNESDTPTVAPPTTLAQPRDDALAQGLDGQHKSLGPTQWWAVIVLLVGLGWWWAFRHWRHPLTFALGIVPFLLVLVPFYVYLERALPAGY